VKRVSLRHVNAFTTTLFRGNPAGVVVDARGLSDERMQLIARELGMPETAFVLPPSLRGADIQIRWFSPAVEIPLCGHATIAAFHVLAEEGTHGMRHNGVYTFHVQTLSGILQTSVDKKASGISVEFHLPVPNFSLVRRIPPALARPLGILRADLDPAFPVARAASYLYIPVKRRSRLWAVRPDMKALADGCRERGLIGVSLVTLDTVEESSAFHSRFFAPAAGIDEDPVTGSANGPLGVYCFTYGIRRGTALPSYILEDDRLEFVGEQGDILGRKGRVKVRLKVRKGVAGGVSIAGEAVTVFRTEISF